MCLWFKKWADNKYCDYIYLQRAWPNSINNQ
jgi:hypothetical protein